MYAAGATISPLQGAGGLRTIAAQLDNQSTLTIGDPQGLTFGRAGAVSTNSGTIAVTTGSLTLNQSGTTPSFTNTGTITLRSEERRVGKECRFGLSAGPLNGA